MAARPLRNDRKTKGRKKRAPRKAEPTPRAPLQVESLEPRILLSATWVGTGGDDVFGGTNDADVADGLDGADELHGGNMDDQLFGGAGNDVLYGDNHVDTLDGGTGDDQLFGGQHDDTLIRGGGNDYMDGGLQDDVFRFTGAGDGDVVTATVNVTVDAAPPPNAAPDPVPDAVDDPPVPDAVDDTDGLPSPLTPPHTPDTDLTAEADPPAVDPPQEPVEETEPPGDVVDHGNIHDQQRGDSGVGAPEGTQTDPVDVPTEAITGQVDQSDEQPALPTDRPDQSDNAVSGGTPGAADQDDTSASDAIQQDSAEDLVVLDHDDRFYR